MPRASYTLLLFRGLCRVGHHGRGGVLVHLSLTLPQVRGFAARFVSAETKLLATDLDCRALTV